MCQGNRRIVRAIELHEMIDVRRHDIGKAALAGECHDLLGGGQCVEAIEVEPQKAVSQGARPFLCLRAAIAIFEPERRSAEHTSELPSLIRSSYAVFCLTKQNNERTL